MFSHSVTANSYPDPAWRARVLFATCAVILLWPLLVATQFKPWEMFDAQTLKSTRHFLATFFPPVVNAEFLLLVLQATWQTIAIATTGLCLALVLAIPLTLVGTSCLSISRLGRERMAAWPYAVRQMVRFGLVALRSVPELIFALLFVRIVGLGPTAGVLAIALSYAGMLGKVYAEILESADKSATENLLRNGATRLQAFIYGALPQSASELMSYTVYRWECAVRGSVIMGFVGAGGLGQQMDTSVKMLAGGEVATMLVMFMLLVALADGVSAFLRKRLA